MGLLYRGKMGQHFITIFKSKTSIRLAYCSLINTSVSLLTVSFHMMARVNILFFFLSIVDEFNSQFVGKLVAWTGGYVIIGASPSLVDDRI